jgi:glucosyl-dolichyl phosphate glucuronosyltransferase
MAERSNISVVICAYSDDRWDDLHASIESVRAQSVPAHEIVVSVDHNPRLFSRVQANNPDIVVAENRETRGLSGARNSGIAASSGAIVAFLDDDAAAAPDWLGWLVQGYADEQVLGVGGAIEPVWLGGRPWWFPEEFRWVVGCTYLGMPDRPASVRNLIGCNMSFRREVFDEVGGFQSGIGRLGTRPLGCEETELCIRVRQRWPEKTLFYDPRAVVHHQVPASRGQWRYFRSRCYAEGLSKALVSQFVGAGDGLASERTYTMRTLPRGVASGVRDSVLQRNAVGVARAAAITSGLAITTTGYLMGSIMQRRAPNGTRASSKAGGLHVDTR